MLDAFDKYNKFDAFSSETTIMKMMEIMQDIKRTESIRMKASLALRNQSKLPEQAAINLIELIQNVDTATDLRGYCYEPIPRYLGIRNASWVSLFVSSTRRDRIKVKSVRKRGLESSPY